MSDSPAQDSQHAITAPRRFNEAWDAELLRPIVFLQPDRMVHPPSWIEHIPFAFWLMDVLRPRVFVELGTHAGNSYGALAQAVQHLGLAAAGYAVDTWKGDPQAGFYDESVYTQWKSYHDRRYAAFSTLVRTTFDDACNHFPDGSIDLLNIDGYHTADAVNHDFERWRPKMSARGVVLLHDTNVRERDFGAWEAWQRLAATYPCFEFLHGHGLGVLAVGADLPAGVHWLIDGSAGPSHAVAVRRFFARAGAGLLAQYQADNLLTDLEAAKPAPPSGESAEASPSPPVEAPEGVDAELDDRLAEAATRIERAEIQIAETEGQLAAVAAELSSRDGALAALQTLSLLHAVAESTAAQARAGLAARFGALADRYRRTRPPGTRISRIVATLRALELLPGDLLRHPRRLRRLVRFASRPRLLRDAHQIFASGLFDAAYYVRLAPDLAAAGANPLAHFVMAGGAEGRPPCLLFDAAWYLAKYPDVAAARANPLAHYLRAARQENRDPHPLFSSAYYRGQLGPQGGGVDPLQHYVSDGVFAGLSPHPLFDPGFYVESCGSRLNSFDPFSHFLEEGAEAGLDPHPLFDIRYYRGQMRPSERAGNALSHYVGAGASRNRSPHPLFDPGYYRRHNDDVTASGVDSLIHFVTTGGREGRAAHPEFDSAWYLATYPDVAASGANPLVHYLRHGWLEGRNPSPHFDTKEYLGRHPEIARNGLNPLTHHVCDHLNGAAIRGPEPGTARPAVPAESERLRLRASSPMRGPAPARVIVCLSHVLPVAPRAGNEYRIHRMLTWLRRAGYVIIPVIAPVDGSEPGRDVLEMIAAQFNNAVICLPDGRVQYVLRDLPDVLRSLDGELTEGIASQLEEQEHWTDHEWDLLQIERSFCSDTLITTVLRLQSAIGRYVLLAEYIWMSRVLPLTGTRALKIIDTIDVFSTRGEKVGQYGVQDLVVEPAAESRRLARGDVMIAIQQNERQALEALVPGMPVVTAGVDFDVAPTTGAPFGRQVLYVASDNPMNRHGLRDFLRFAWPRVRNAIPDAELRVVGGVGESLPIAPAGVHVLGRVDDLAPLYSACRVVINPAIAGTGVKVKTLEALSYLRRVVAWPNGVDGLSPAVAGLCYTAQDWYSFAEQLVNVLTNDAAAVLSAEDRELLAREGCPDQVYAELGRVIDEFFGRDTDDDHATRLDYKPQ